MTKTGHDPRMAAVEAIEREQARREFLPFCKFVDGKHPIEARHVQHLGEKLEQVAKYILTDGKEGINRLMVFMPPRYWKSQTASRKFPAWLLGKNPDLRIILTSYGADLATKHSKAVRDLILTKKYQSVFGELSSVGNPVVLDPESKSSAAWDIADHIGGMQATGVGGGVTGFGANLFIIDDPVKGRKEAQSETLREDAFEWYKGTAYTRLEDHAAIIVIMTRWDIEDLSGLLLKAMVSDPEADKWDVVCMPAIALEENQYPRNEAEFVENCLRGIYIPMGGDQLGRKVGEPLWAEKHDIPALKKVEANMDKFEFVAQYQQTPKLDDGNFFDEDNFGIIERAPEGLQWFRYVDLALGKTQQSDFNASAAVALHVADLIIRDMLREQDLDSFLGLMRAAMLSDDEKGTIWGIEDNAFQSLVVKQFLEDPRLTNVSIIGITRTSAGGDKTEWAQPWRLRSQKGHVKLVRGLWNLAFLREAASFSPTCRNDDQIDTVSGGNQMIAENVSGVGKTASARAVVVTAESLFSGRSSVFSQK